ncbi:hypothetical protein LCGC14_3022290, partial [marine sediment metagenome]
MRSGEKVSSPGVIRMKIDASGNPQISISNKHRGGTGITPNRIGLRAPGGALNVYPQKK